MRYFYIGKPEFEPLSQNVKEIAPEDRPAPSVTVKLNEDTSVLIGLEFIRSYAEIIGLIPDTK